MEEIIARIIYSEMDLESPTCGYEYDHAAREKAIEMAKAVACAIERQSWQPIETAPKDGRWLLLNDPQPQEWQHVDLPMVQIAKWQINPHPLGENYGWFTIELGSNPDSYEIESPTQWRPLPQPPTAKL